VLCAFIPSANICLLKPYKTVSKILRESLNAYNYGNLSALHGNLIVEGFRVFKQSLFNLLNVAELQNICRKLFDIQSPQVQSTGIFSLFITQSNTELNREESWYSRGHLINAFYSNIIKRLVVIL
jgi:hypothetical protein